MPEPQKAPSPVPRYEPEPHVQVCPPAPEPFVPPPPPPQAPLSSTTETNQNDDWDDENLYESPPPPQENNLYSEPPKQTYAEPDYYQEPPAPAPPAPAPAPIKIQALPTAMALWDYQTKDDDQISFD